MFLRLHGVQQSSGIGAFSITGAGATG